MSDIGVKNSKENMDGSNFECRTKMFTNYLSAIAVKPPTSGGGYKAIVKCDEFCYTHLTIFNVLHSTVKLRLNCEYAVT